MVELPAEQTLVGHLRRLATERPHHRYVTWLDGKGRESIVVTYQQLWCDVVAVAELLVHKGVQPGDRVMVSYPPGPQFLAGLFGTILAGAIPCSVYPPNSLPRSSKIAKQHSFDQFNTQAKDAGATFAVTTQVFQRLLRTTALTSSLYRTPNLTWLATDTLNNKTAATTTPELTQRKLHRLALIQYSSGSTSAPKGVMIPHTSLDANLRAVHANSFPTPTPDTLKMIGWLPQYHDYGLVGGYFSFVYTPQAEIVAFSPVDFIRNPLLWADILDRYANSPTMTCGPDFSYALLAKRMQHAGRVLLQQPSSSKVHGDKDETPTRSLLLRASMGGESVAETTMEGMKAIGISSASINPHYGMAECCLYVSSVLGDDEIRVADDGIVSMGNIERCLASDIWFRIVDPDTRECRTDGQEGEIMVWSTSLASGYWGKPELSRQTFAAMTLEGKEYMATGDIGKICDGQLYVCGRLKELIIVNGKNLYPTDLERSINNTFGAIVRPGCTVAYQNSPTEAGVIVEIRNSAMADGSNSQLSLDSIRSLIQGAHNIAVGRIDVLKQGSVPKTTSGKLRRVEARRCSLAGEWSKKATLSKWAQGASSRPLASPKGPENKQSLNDVLGEFFDGMYDPESTWEELGLSSIATVQLRDRVSENFCVSLPLDFQEEYPTPASLFVFVETNTQQPFQVQLWPLPGSMDDSKKLMPWTVLLFVQGVGILLLLLTVAFSFVPSYHCAKFLASKPRLTGSTDRVEWQWLPIVIPVWMLAFTLIVILSKWCGIGRYREQEVKVPSVQFIRWWFVDRLVSIWEQWVGQLIIDTPFLWLAYVLMGATIHPSAKLSAFVREFDLVEVGAHTAVESDIVCRRFSVWSGDDNLRLRFRRIRIGRQCTVRGVVGLGAGLADRSYVELLAAVPEGAQVPAGALAKGSPALHHGNNRKYKTDTELPSTLWIVALNAMKIFGMISELYLFFAYLLLSQWLINGRLPANFRYSKLIYWIVLLLLSVIMSMLTCVGLKWLTIGKKLPGPVSTTFWGDYTDWLVDYHFSLSLSIFNIFFENSRISNLYLMALGMDLDLKSQVWAVYCPPSKVDLLHVRRSVLSTVVFDLGDDPKPITIIDSSMGHSVVLEGDTKIFQSHLKPFCQISGVRSGDRATTSFRYGFWTDLYAFASAAFFAAGTIPAYEVFQQWDAGDPVGLGFSVARIALVLAVQVTMWLSLFALLNKSLFVKGPTGDWRVRSQALFGVYMAISYYLIWRFSLLDLTWGTPFINWYLRLLGAKVEGRMLYFAISSYDFPLLTFRNQTVVDRSVISGHYGDISGIHFGPSTTAGVLHPGTVLIANADSTGLAECGPSRFIVKQRGNSVTSSGTDYA